MNFQIVATPTTWRALQERMPENLFLKGSAPEDGPCFTIELIDPTGSRELLVWQGAPLGPWAAQAMPLHEYLKRASTPPSFWELAFAWRVYEEVLTADEAWGKRYHFLWPSVLESPHPVDPMLSFLDISRGYLIWDFQLELAYRLADPSYGASIQFRKDWNAKKASAFRQAEALRLADGRTLTEVLESTVLLSTVTGIPSRTVNQILAAIRR